MCNGRTTPPPGAGDRLNNLVATLYLYFMTHKTKSGKRFILKWVRLVLTAGIFAAWLPSLWAQGGNHGVAAANLIVVQNDISNNVESVTVTAAVSVNEFSVRPGSNRGDYMVQIGAGFSDDVDNGVLMTCVAENGRDNGEAAYPGVNFCTSAMEYSRSGGNTGAYYIPVFNAPVGAEYNINVAAAFFPYDQWLGGYARNSGDTNGGANDLFTGSPGLALGAQFVDNGSGVSTVDLTSLGIDSRTDGVLLVTYGKNEDNFATSQVNSNNGTWTIYSKDNGANADANEQDPVAFVYVPKTNTMVISGRFNGNGTRLIYSGATPQYSVTNTSIGNWRLTIPGHTPASGVLIISPEGGLSGNQDNIVSYQPDGDGWIIQSRDLPANPPGLQTPGSGLEPVASFVFIPAAATATLVSPAHNAQNQVSSPTLQVTVSNTAPGNATVQFYGRVAPVNPATDFSIIALPDTQYYAALRNGGLPAMWYAQTEWIITNRIPRNIAYVAHLGDIVDHGDNNGGTPLNEWKVATNAMYRLEDPNRTSPATGIPYGTAVGNHDESPNGDSTGTTTYYNQYFGVSHFAGKPYYAGHHGANNNNHFDFFSAGGMEFIVLYFQYDTTLNPVWLNWGNDVLRTNAHRRAIIVTHYFGNTATPTCSFGAQGSAIYNALKTNKNVFMMLSGHVTGQGIRTDTYQGNTIRTFVSDYQGWTNGGNGFMRIIDFSPANNQVVLTTYSPWTGEYDTTHANSEVFFTYNMAEPVGTNFSEFELIGTVTNVPSGSLASLVWSNRAVNTLYEWRVVVGDEAGNYSTGDTWRFATAPNSPPTVANALLTIYGDAPTNLTLTANDPNGDPLTFTNLTQPTHGWLSNVNPAGGAYTYSPVRGYRGTDRFTFSAHDGTASSGAASMNFNVIAPPDTNANGLPDGWEAAYGVSDPNGDDDGDGRSNLEEYYANTNPTNAASRLQVTSAVSQPNGFFDLTWDAVGGTRYRVQYGSVLSGSGDSFTDLVRELTNELDASSYGMPSTQSFTDDFTLTPVPTNGSRYYRIKVVP